ncbi:uncharacterized protein LOC125032331 [Penaeus chinensis]|uniref:uncharacterized protein LOC125032331 n=1 Tax=Penaeus chinensis TaxID=139456 RepID=UPI001FB7D464|nr:uncharacterized protein LOC125032331 [Penaeus chinensis]
MTTPLTPLDDAIAGSETRSKIIVLEYLGGCVNGEKGRQGYATRRAGSDVMSSHVEAARDAAHEERWERREAREERPSLRAKSSGGTSVIVVSESGRLLRASAASLPSVARSFGGGGGRLRAPDPKRDPGLLVRSGAGAPRTVHLKPRLPEVDAAQSKADSGARAVGAGSVSASVSGAEASAPPEAPSSLPCTTKAALLTPRRTPTAGVVWGPPPRPRLRPGPPKPDEGGWRGAAVFRLKVYTVGYNSRASFKNYGFMSLNFVVVDDLKLEARGSTEPEVLSVPNTVQLPGAPRDPAMMEARKELVERVINASLDIFLEKSQEAIIAAIFTSQRMQNALRAFELSRGVQLPTDDELGLLSRIVLAEWRRHLFNLTARYHAIITRNAHGLKTEEKERSEFWSSELPPPPLPWTFWTALFHVFCLVSTIGGSIEAATMGGRTTTVMYSFLGVSLYVVTVVVWAARCGAALSGILRLFAKKKVESSSGKGRPSPYRSMDERRPSPAHHSLRGLVTLIFLLLVYVLSAGVHLVGGRDYWCGLENSILVLVTIRPPTPIPQEKAEVLGFIAFVMVGHILLALLLAISKALCGRWWAAWSGTAS